MAAVEVGVAQFLKLLLTFNISYNIINGVKFEKMFNNDLKVEQWAAQHYNRRLANPAAPAAGFGSGFNGNGYPAPPGAPAGSPFLPTINGNPAATPGATVHHPPTAGATVSDSGVL